MICIVEKYNCCGCGACVQRCPKQCITFSYDQEGFRYPTVEENECIECGLCEKVCPMLQPEKVNAVEETYAAYNKDNKIVAKSTSGGVFASFVQCVIDRNGVVFGARFDDQWRVMLDYAETMKDAVKFSGSKYVEAGIGNVYIQVEKFLKERRMVLFSGTPCQIAGLRAFLRKEYEKLITVEVVCHGVPSTKVWHSYLMELIDNFGDGDNSNLEEIKSVNFRYKPDGWRRYKLKVDFRNGKSYAVNRGDDAYLKSFVASLDSRPCCFHCKFKDGRSRADITLGDYWCVEKIQPEMDNQMGCNVVIINSEKGMNLIPMDDLVIQKANLEEAKKYNEGLHADNIPHPRREEFFIRLNAGGKISSIVDDIFAPTLKDKINLSYWYLKNRLSLLIKKFNK